jgi:short-subunit dehydrogenase
VRQLFANPHISFKLTNLYCLSAAKSPLILTKTIAMDLSKPTPQAFSAYSEWLASPGVEVGVLINNAGVSHSMPVSFAETSQEEMDTILQVVSLAHRSPGGNRY